MPEVQQVKRLILAQFQQFRLCDLDFTDPSTGRSLHRICLTGPNGCGKSTILAQIYHAVDPEMLPLAVDEDREANALILVKYGLGAQSVYLARNGLRLGASGSKFTWFSDDIENSPGWPAFLEKGMGFHEFDDQFEDYAVNPDDSLTAPDSATAWFSPNMDLVNSSPADDLREMIDSLGEQRSHLFHEFLRHPDNRNETVSSVEDLFEQAFPDPLVSISNAWERVLTPANITFSREGQGGLLSTRTGERILFSSLSPGLQRFLLRTGHLRLLKLENRHDRSLYVFDEPENGLGEDLASSLLEDAIGHGIGPEAQTFVATRSPSLVRTFTEAETFRLLFDNADGIRLDRDLPTEPVPSEESADAPEQSVPTPPPNAVRLARLKREIQESEDQDELADLLDEWISIRRR
ncbi:MAG: hypothetical protein AAF491_10295 [Verrucomicrobiota bacterium]